MENGNVLLTALGISAIGLLVLVGVLVLLAFLVNGMTSILKGKGDEEEEEQEEGAEEAVEETAQESDVLKLQAAAVAVALARAEFELSPVSSGAENRDFIPWREYHRARRLNQSVRTRRN